MDPDQELLAYLTTLISPPSPAGTAVVLDLSDPTWHIGADNSLTGAIVKGTPTEADTAHLHRLLCPGAYLLIIATEQEPTGHTAACRVEDRGFEIRDTILLLEEDQGFHYVPKAGRSEREAGCQHLPAKTAGEALDREEGSAGLASPRAGAGRTNAHIHNHHPTVKPVDLMKGLLADIPTAQGPVLDPFLGSGTTGVACLDTGHDFIGIDQEAEYLTIAEARIRYWDTAVFRSRSLELESEAPVVAPQVDGGLWAELFGSEDEP